MNDLATVINSIIDDDIRALLNELLMKKFSHEFMTEPAACNKHHNYPGGLLDHSMSVVRNVKNIAYHYQPVSYDLCIAGALLHDIGKVHCYILGEKLEDTNGPASGIKVISTYNRTYLDEYIGHISEGYRLVMNAGEYLNLPMEKVQQIGHIIISSHGKREWGSPVEPKTREAFIVHQADMIDAYLTGWEQCNEKPKNK